MSGAIEGILTIVAAGAMLGSFTVPQKYMRGWSWALGWLVYSVAGMIAIPWLILQATVPAPWSVYQQVGTRQLILSGVFGAGWGIGSVLLGIGISRVGVALGFAVVITLTAAVGSVVPFVVLRPGAVFSAQGLVLLAGLGMVIAGVALCARAGRLRDSARAVASGTGNAGRRGFLLGIVICIASGLTSPMINMSLAFGGSISSEALRQGASAAGASTAALAWAIGSGFWINAGYCVFQMARGKREPVSGSTGVRNVLLAIAMGMLWMFALHFYGIGAGLLGTEGTALGWTLFQIVAVLTANVWGIATGEWRGAGSAAMRNLAVGTATMVGALAVISWGAMAR